MSKQQNKNTGNKGEQAAAELLVRKGYTILVRNYRSKWGEVDIICRHRDITIFVEVKTKTGSAFGEPWEMISAWKLHQVERMGQVSEEYGWNGLCRVDVVGVWVNHLGEIDKIEHWENVVL